jgi:hypothetical protein
MAGVQCLKKGSVWRIGDGQKVNIWEDAWISGSFNRKVLTPRGNCLLSHVNELIDPISYQCDEELVRDHFWTIDANRILRIPLTNGVEDFIAWHYSKIGIFSVKSAYHVEWEHQHGRKSR